MQNICIAQIFCLFVSNVYFITREKPGIDIFTLGKNGRKNQGSVGSDVGDWWDPH